MRRSERYKQIAEMAEWVNANRVSVAKDGMNIIIAIADEEKIRRLACTGQPMQLGMMFGVLIDGINQPGSVMPLDNES